MRLIRRLNLTANRVLEEQAVLEEPAFEQLDLFTDYAAAQEAQLRENAELAREKKLQTAMQGIKKKYGKNAILKGMDLEAEATASGRNRQIGGIRRDWKIRRYVQHATPCLCDLSPDVHA